MQERSYIHGATESEVMGKYNEELVAGFWLWECKSLEEEERIRDQITRAK